LPIISQEGAEEVENNGNMPYWQQMALHGLDSESMSKGEDFLKLCNVQRIDAIILTAIEAKTVTKQWTRHICWYCFEAVVNGSRRHNPLNVAQLQEIHSNRSTLPANVFVIQTELGNGKDSNGRVRSLPIISQEGAEEVVNGSRRHIFFTLDLGTSRRISSRKWFNCKNKRSIQVK
jgi:hypothetical protein